MAFGTCSCLREEATAAGHTGGLGPGDKEASVRGGAVRVEPVPSTRCYIKFEVTAAELGTFGIFKCFQ